MTHVSISDVKNTCYKEHAIIKINLQIISDAEGLVQL